jgi:hypothetical protein
MIRRRNEDAQVPRPAAEPGPPRPCDRRAGPGAGDIRSERVQFPKGKTGTTIKGRISGDQIVDYKLCARAGQRIIVKLETDNSSNFGVCSSATFLLVNPPTKRRRPPRPQTSRHRRS